MLSLAGLVTNEDLHEKGESAEPVTISFTADDADKVLKLRRMLAQRQHMLV